MPKRVKGKNAYPNLNFKRKTLADGSVVTYYWAYKGGPSLPGKYGSPEFTEAYLAATVAKKAAPEGVIFSLLAAYQLSSAFTDLAPRTRADYIKQIKKIEVAFGDLPLSALEDRRVRGEFLAWRDRLAVKSRRQADYAFSVLARVLSVAKDRGLIAINPCERSGERLYQSSRAEMIWTDDDEALFLSKAPVQFHLPFEIALFTGQREGDILKLNWRHYDGHRLRLQQGKTKARVVIPVGLGLRTRLDKMLASLNPGKFDHIVLNTRGKPWTEAGFSSAFAQASNEAGIVGLTFHDTRGTAVTRLSIAGATVPEIATFTGHSLRDVTAILDANYLNRDPAMAESAARKLEARTQVPDLMPDRSFASKP